MFWREDMIGLEGTLFKRRELKEAFEKRFDSKGNEGWKVHSKRGRIRKHTTQEMRAQRRTRKEVWLENALSEGWRLEGALERRIGLESTISRVEGSRVHLKWGRVIRRADWDGWWLEGTLKEKEDRARKHTIWMMRAQKPLKKRWWEDTDMSRMKVMHHDQYTCILTWEI
jgi:hypothetical protein